MLMDIAYTYKRKHKCSVLPLKIWRIQIWDSFAMLFLQTAYISLVSGCKITQLFPYSEKKFELEEKAKEVPRHSELKKVQFPRETAPLKCLEISK